MNKQLKISGVNDFIKMVDDRMSLEGAPPPSMALLEIKSVHSSINRGCSCRKKFREEHAELAFVEVMKQLTVPDSEQIISLAFLRQDYDSLLIVSKAEEELISRRARE